MIATVAPVTGPEDRSGRLRAPLSTAGAVSAATLALRLRDPHRHGAWGLCPFKLLTGWDCPACGSLRAVADLTHGQVLAAVHSNLALVAAAPVALVLWAGWALRAWRGVPPRAASPRRRALTRAVGIVAGAAFLAFSVWRNTPWGSAFHAA